MDNPAFTEQNKVCDDFEGATWHFDKGRYYKIRDSKIIAMVDGTFLSDPEIIWQNKCEKHSVARGTNEVYQNGATIWLKPSSAVFALWKHWQEASAS